jgi:hypothetical protein
LRVLPTEAAARASVRPPQFEFANSIKGSLFSQHGCLAIEEMQRIFETNFESMKVEHGQRMPSAWYTFERK